MKAPHLIKHRSVGFSLLEVMLSLILIGLLISGFLTGYQVYIAEKQESKEDQTYDSARSAMNAFITERMGASLRARYPCPARLDIGPDNAAYGQERRNADGTCQAAVDGSNGVFDAGDVYIGAFPAKTLGLSADMMLDAHGNKLSYAITKSHTLDDALLADPDGLVVVQDESGLSSVNAPFALISHGQDGAGAYSIEGGVVLPCRDGAAADGENCDFDDAVFKESRVKLGNSSNFYDDRLAFSLADEDDDEWWSPFDDDPGHIHNKNPGIICIGAGCDHSDAVVGDVLVANGNARIMDDLFVVDMISAGGDLLAGGSVLADGDVWSRNNIEANKSIRALESIVAGDIDPATLGTGDIAAKGKVVGKDKGLFGEFPPTATTLGVHGYAKIVNGALEIDTDGDDTWASIYESNYDTIDRLIISSDKATARREDIVIHNSGKVGIGGVKNPGSTLEVGGEVRIVDGGLMIDSDDDNNWGSLYNHSGDVEGLVISAKSITNGRKDIVINENGKIGIGGIVDPQSSLDVSGGVKIGGDDDICNVSKEGTQRYNSDDKVMEFCDGENWRPFSSSLNIFAVENRLCTRDGAHTVTSTCPEGYKLLSCVGGPGDVSENAEYWTLVPDYANNRCIGNIKEPAYFGNLNSCARVFAACYQYLSGATPTADTPDAPPEGPIAGQCGVHHEAGRSTRPEDPGLCAVGTPTAVSGTGPWTWQCQGYNGGAAASCQSSLAGGASCTSAVTLPTYYDPRHCTTPASGLHAEVKQGTCSESGGPTLNCTVQCYNGEWKLVTFACPYPGP